MTARGLTTVAAVYRRCRVVGGCWIWQGATDEGGTPALHTVDHSRQEKRTLKGARAMWNIAYGPVPEGKLPYRCCFTRTCMNPGHIKLASSQGEIVRAAAAVGKLRRDPAKVQKAILASMAARGQQITPVEVVLAVKRAPPRSELSNKALASQLGVHHSVVSRIRLGQTHRGVVA